MVKVITHVGVTPKNIIENKNAICDFLWSWLDEEEKIYLDNYLLTKNTQPKNDISVKVEYFFSYGNW